MFPKILANGRDFLFSGNVDFDRSLLASRLPGMIRVLLPLLLVFSMTDLKAQENTPLKVGVIGLTHTHVHWILGREDRGDIEIVGVVEPNQDLAQRYMKLHNLSMDLVYPTMEAMVNAADVEAVTAFGSIFEHLEVVQFFAPRGIHVMVEKPLAVSMEHATEMARLAKKHSIHLLTNYETSWYATNTRAYEMVQAGKLGTLRKIIVRDGHEGPIEIGVNQEFLDWLTDPVQNGGGAVTDFGCYGANLVTWLNQGKRPLSVTAITKSYKPEKYPKVDDEAIILLEYEDMTAILEASWNWPFNRKDMEVYGTTGYVISDNGTDMRVRLAGEDKAIAMTADPLPISRNDPFALLSAIVKGELTIEDHDVSALKNNLLVVEILDAARKSAKTGRKIELSK